MCYYFYRQFIGSHLTRLEHGFGRISVSVKTKSDNGSEMKQMQLLCYKGTLK